MVEAGENSSVVDAFDDGDLIDLHLDLSFRQTFERSRILRETSLAQDGLSDSGFVAGTENVATFVHSRSVLSFGAELGIFRDLALTHRLPLVLSDARELADVDDAARNGERRSDPTGDMLFPVPFRSPKRSGIDWFSLGLRWGALNQQRRPSQPNLILAIEGRMAVGERLHACNAAAGNTCPDPQNPAPEASRDPGISRGVHAAVATLLVSRRYTSLEPYAEGTYTVQVAQSNSDLARSASADGVERREPPRIATIAIGSELILWENRELWQRLLIDGHTRFTHLTSGREYSELFDALGSSPARSLRDPQTFTAAGAGQAPPFTGATVQGAHAKAAAGASVVWQAGEHVKFVAGGGLTWTERHAITGVDGRDDPSFRSAIDAPGRRFHVANGTTIHIWLSSAVMF